jgi:hypothetical protein
MIESRLLLAADDLCRSTGGRPRDAFMRRAVSTAYYALFHALARLCADELVGRAHARTSAYARVYRALDHGGARRAFRSPEAALLGADVSHVGLAFVELQQERHRADYDPSGFGYMFDETRAAVAKAREAIALLAALEPDARRSLATLLLFKSRDRNDR